MSKQIANFWADQLESEMMTDEFSLLTIVASITRETQTIYMKLSSQHFAHRLYYVHDVNGTEYWFSKLASAIVTNKQHTLVLKVQQRVFIKISSFKRHPKVEQNWVDPRLEHQF